METESLFRKLRQTLGVSGRTLAKRLGVSSATLYRYELQEAEMSDETVAALLDVIRPVILETLKEAQPEEVASFATFSDALSYATRLAHIAEQKDQSPASRIRQLRRERHLSFTEFAELTGVDRTVLSRIESASYNCTARTAKQIGAACCVGAEWILTGNERYKDYPVDEQLIEWLWQHQDVRDRLYCRMGFLAAKLAASSAPEAKPDAKPDTAQAASDDDVDKYYPAFDFEFEPEFEPHPRSPL